ncbi:Uncharacterised protein [Bordetella pertussis]|nr:Uncharacterised protein [Bordetella pertussis]CFT95861.1 Uncharacterised protein [Bordetella pertussis]CFW30803.1 Uncharacterised protein [Bordetella pertussis]
MRRLCNVGDSLSTLRQPSTAATEGRLSTGSAW